MAVYVSPMFDVPKRTKSKWNWPRACHMVADTSLELDDMAYELGLKPHWKQDPLTPKEHYDLNGTMRERAIRCGAMQVDHRKIARLMAEKAARQIQTGSPHA